MKLAIIGASVGQLPLCIKAKEMGIETICFAWDKGAICKEYVDKFYPISIIEKDKILEKCILEKVDGIVSNASDILVETVSYVSEHMGLHGNSYNQIINLKNKAFVRNLTKGVKDLSEIKYVESVNHNFAPFYPCIIKPVTGASKKGVSFVRGESEFIGAVNYSKEDYDGSIR